MPRTEKVLTVHLRLLITPELDNLLNDAAKYDHRKKPDFIRHHLDAVCRKVILDASSLEMKERADAQMKLNDEVLRSLNLNNLLNIEKPKGKKK